MRRPRAARVAPSPLRAAAAVGVLAAASLGAPMAGLPAARPAAATPASVGGVVHRGAPGTPAAGRVVDVAALLARPGPIVRTGLAEGAAGSAAAEPVRNLRKGPTPVPGEVPAGFRAGSLDAPDPLEPVDEVATTPATVAESFVGLTTGAVPPDTAAAMGPTHAVTAVNGRLSLRNRASGATVSLTDAAFWGEGVVGDHGDPIVHYDPYANRWIFVEISYPKTTRSQVSLAVSQNADPTGLWNLRPLVADPTGRAWADRPRVGFSKQHIVITANHFSVDRDTFVDVFVYAVDKASVYAGGPSNARVFSGEATENFFGSSAPAATYDPDESTTYLVESATGRGSGGFGFLIVHAVAGTPAEPVLYDVPAVPATTETWASRVTNANLLPQPGGVGLDAGNDEIGWAVYRNGLIWVAHTVFYPAAAPTRAAVQWWALAPNGARVQRGVIDSGNVSTMYAYPSVAVNRRNDVVIGFTRFSTGSFPSAAFAFRAGTDLARSTEAPVVVRSGEAAYQVPCTPSDADDRCRWGDYSASAVDPVNDLDLWTVQQYAAVPPSTRAYQMGLFWQRVVPPSPPTGNYAALAPARLLDTREGAGRLRAEQVADLAVLERAGVPAAGVTAVALNVTVTEPTGPGYLTVYPSGGGLPLASNLNFRPGQTVANLVVVKVGEAGRVRFFASSSTHVVVDVQGWFGPSAGSAFVPSSAPGRLLDTRLASPGEAKVAAGAPVELAPLARLGVPVASVDAVVLNVTVTDPDGPGFASVYPSGGPPPTASNLNFDAGQTVPNLVIARLGSDGTARVMLSRPAHLVVDVLGWFRPVGVGGGAAFVEAHPVRVLDTRPGVENTGAPAGRVGPNEVLRVPVLGRGGVPLSGVRAVVVNVTATDAEAPGFLTVFPSPPAPTASNLNFVAGQSVPNLVVVAPGPDGHVRIRASVATHVIVDVMGWFPAV